MTSKEQMMAALRREVPDRLPITIHQWQPYHLTHYMGGMDQLEAFVATGLDASVTIAPWAAAPSPRWQQESTPAGRDGDTVLYRHRVQTPEGELTWMSAADEYTTYNVEHIIKNQRDAELFLKYWPDLHLDKAQVRQWHDRTGDSGIVRGFVATFAQPGPWQEFCEMAGTQNAILWALDEPEFVHYFLDEITQRKIAYVCRELDGAPYDLIEHGGGAASSTVISPAMFDEFCAPYDRRIIAALHDVGLPVVYHTCGGMMAILELIPGNGCDASETLSPPAVGGDIRSQDRTTVKQVLGSRVALIGGLDQGVILTESSPNEVEREVEALFETFGVGGGYICSASDHFFHTPVENLRAMARVAQRCRY